MKEQKKEKYYEGHEEGALLTRRLRQAQVSDAADTVTDGTEDGKVGRITDSAKESVEGKAKDREDIAKSGGQEKSWGKSPSVLISWITDHPDTWQEDFKRLGIRTSMEAVRDCRGKAHTFMIFNYNIDCDFSNPLVQEARGIILDLTDLTVVCWPFRKFGNFMESYADSIDWASARVQEKIDGSICKLWYDPCGMKWRWSTNASIMAENAHLQCSAGDIRSYMDAIRHAGNYGIIASAIEGNILDKDCTYIFELTGPYNRVVIRYEKDTLWHIGTRNNRTGRESVTDIGIRHPKEYPLHTQEDCIEAAAKLNMQKPEGILSGSSTSGNGISGDITQEGFVVVDGNWHRIKIKSPAYVTMHRAGMGRITKLDALRYVLRKRERTGQNAMGQKREQKPGQEYISQHISHGGKKAMGPGEEAGKEALYCREGSRGLPSKSRDLEDAGREKMQKDRDFVHAYPAVLRPEIPDPGTTDPKTSEPAAVSLKIPEPELSLENRMLIKYVDFRLAELEMHLQRYIDYVHGLDRELGHDRKAVALTIKNDTFCRYGFMALKSEDITAEDLLYTIRTPTDESRLLRMIPDYKSG